MEVFVNAKEDNLAMSIKMFNDIQFPIQCRVYRTVILAKICLT